MPCKWPSALQRRRACAVPTPDREVAPRKTVAWLRGEERLRRGQSAFHARELRGWAIVGRGRPWCELTRETDAHPGRGPREPSAPRPRRRAPSAVAGGRRGPDAGGPAAAHHQVRRGRGPRPARGARARDPAEEAGRPVAQVRATRRGERARTPRRCPLAHGGPWPDTVAADRERLRLFAEAAARLEGRCREILRRKLEGLSFVEIAAELGRPVNTVYSWDFRCHQRLRKLLGDRWGFVAGEEGDDRRPEAAGSADTPPTRSPTRSDRSCCGRPSTTRRSSTRSSRRKACASCWPTPRPASTSWPRSSARTAWERLRAWLRRPATVADLLTVAAALVVAVVAQQVYQATRPARELPAATRPAPRSLSQAHLDRLAALPASGSGLRQSSRSRATRPAHRRG